MGLETDVAAQESIQDSLESGVDTSSPSTFNFQPQVKSILDRIQSIPTSVKQNINYNAPSTFSDLPSLNVGGFNVSLGPVGNTLGITATKTFAEGGSVDTGNPNDMGLETDIAGQQEVQGGLDPYGTGSDSSTDIQKALYDPKGIKKGLVTPYMKKLLSLGLVSKLQKDKDGRITGVYSTHNPYSLDNLGMGGIMSMLGQAVPGVSTVSNLLSGLFGPATTYTGYNPKSTKDPNDNGNDNELIRKIVPTEDLTPLTSRQIYNQNPNQYTLRTR
jgi:hypothetical protein